MRNYVGKERSFLSHVHSLLHSHFCFLLAETSYAMMSSRPGSKICYPQNFSRGFPDQYSDFVIVFFCFNNQYQYNTAVNNYDVCSICALLGSGQTVYLTNQHLNCLTSVCQISQKIKLILSIFFSFSNGCFSLQHLLRVIPVIGILTNKKAFKPTPNPAEVEAVFDAPLEMFIKVNLFHFY